MQIFCWAAKLQFTALLFIPVSMIPNAKGGDFVKKRLKLLLPAVMLCIAVLLAAIVWCLSREDLPGWEAPKALSSSRQRSVKRELMQIVQLCREAYPGTEGEDAGGLSRESIDAMEAGLLDAGYPVVDTDETYPAYLGNPESLYAFWEDVCAGKDAAQTLIRISEDGGFWHTCLFQEKGERGCLLTHVVRDGENTAYVRTCELLPLYDMELTDWGIFYYRMYPADDPHYIDYSQLRLAPMDRELYDLNRKYIIPVGYQMVNLFLCDWWEGDWGALSFNDLFEYLYEMETGERFEWNGISNWDTTTRTTLPARLFESAVLPYFRIAPEDFREVCGYDEIRECYPWRPAFGDDLASWHYPMCEPEIQSQTVNDDGTITLAVQVYSPDLKTNRLFAHEITIRPLADGGFQYVGNRVTYVSDRGLPPNMARFDLDT